MTVFITCQEEGGGTEKLQCKKGLQIIEVVAFKTPVRCSKTKDMGAIGHIFYIRSDVIRSTAQNDQKKRVHCDGLTTSKFVQVD